MTSAEYLPAVQRAADVLRAAQPWLLVPYVPGEWRVASRRTAWTALVVWCINLWRRPVRWWLGRLRLAREARYFQRKRNGG